MNIMRTTVALNPQPYRTEFGPVVLSLVLAAAATCGARPTYGDTFPYVARVAVDQAMVYSGPGRSHYASQILSAGDTVEIFRHDPGGWCAIRPPEGSFSLVLADDMQQHEQMVVVLRDGIQAWVGTHLGPVDQPMWQVRLKKGERLEMLGIVEPPTDSPDGKTPAWIQIAPPAGEFRWIHRDDLFDDRWEEPRMEDLAPPSPEVLVEHAEDELEISSTPKEPAGSALNNEVPQRADSTPEPAPLLLASAMEDGLAQFRSSRAKPSDQAPPKPIEFDEDDYWPMLNQANTHRDGSLPLRHIREHSSSDADRSAAVNNRLAERVGGDGVSGWRRAARPMASLVSAQLTPGVHPEGPAAGGAAPHAFDQAFVSASEPRGNDDRVSIPAPVTPPVTSSHSAASSGPLPESLQRIEMQLTQQLIAAPEHWNLDPLIHQASMILSRADDDLTRQQAAHLLSKLQRSRELQQSLHTAGTAPPRWAFHGNGNLPPAGQMTGAGQRQPIVPSQRQVLPGGQASSFDLIAPNSEPSGQYDAVGVLNEMVRGGGTQNAEFVLQDEHGNITHHIAARPGVNLHRYLRRQVGVIGQRGFHQHLNLPHVTVDRVIVLDRGK